MRREPGERTGERGGDMLLEQGDDTHVCTGSPACSDPCEGQRTDMRKEQQSSSC